MLVRGHAFEASSAFVVPDHPESRRLFAGREAAEAQALRAREAGGPDL
jgi:hypothetical protein